MRLPPLLVLSVSVLSLSVVGCSRSASDGGTPAPLAAPAAGRATLGSGLVARVGSVDVPASLVGAVAGQQALSPSAALDALVADALLAQGALQGDTATRPAIAGELVAARARDTVSAVHQRTVAAGPPTDAEVAEITARHWRQVDLPEQMRAVHAVALRPSAPDPGKEARARAVAAAIEQAVAGAATPEEFEARANAVPHEGVDVRVERLPDFVEDGRMATEEGELDPAFSKAALALRAGQTSPVVETPFGWHVIRAIERLPAKRVPLEERRAAFAVEAREMRGRKEMDQLLATLRARTHIEVSPAADSILRDAKLP